jgi:hypothetical protein
MRRFNTVINKSYKQRQLEDMLLSIFIVLCISIALYYLTDKYFPYCIPILILIFVKYIYDSRKDYRKILKVLEIKEINCCIQIECSNGSINSIEIPFKELYVNLKEHVYVSFSRYELQIFQNDKLIIGQINNEYWSLDQIRTMFSELNRIVYSDKGSRSGSNV